ncbi:MAG TPA: type II toxin-antitoxin system RelE/ParE family toxin [Oleiagrimonas sp.]|nr:type II toxin-antitoxin system RelE/ParE family toxin [Oleiagrimonas sp.]
MEGITVRTLPEFDAWLHALRDPKTKARLLVRLRKATLGNPGDVKSVGGGIYEMREHFGSGWRMYYVQRGTALIVLLAGGSKRTQLRDIANAKRLAALLDDD